MILGDVGVDVFFQSQEIVDKIVYVWDYQTLLYVLAVFVAGAVLYFLRYKLKWGEDTSGIPNVDLRDKHAKVQDKARKDVIEKAVRGGNITREDLEAMKKEDNDAETETDKSIY